MGAINYGTSDYITIGYNCNLDYDEADFNSPEEMENCRFWDMDESREEIETILQKYDFYYYHVVIKPGYYEGFYIDIENNFGYCYDDYTDKKEAQKEITQIKLFLLECVNAGLCEVFPGWCTSYKDYKTSVQAIKEAIKEIREDARTIPTYYTLKEV